MSATPPPPNSNSSATSPILTGLMGRFEVGQNVVPYLSTVMTATACRDALSLAGDNAEFTLESGDVDSLFQRDVDWSRVIAMSDSYLRGQNSPPFFNSITVALICNQSAQARPVPEDPRDDRTYYPRSQSASGVRLSWQGDQHHPSNGSFANAYWLKDDVNAIAIDGQHRLAALSRLASRHPERGALIGVPVLILLLEPEFGLEVNDPALQGDKLGLIRNLFIDLNKHAKTVDRTRQLLLDDRDPMSISVRGTIGKSLNYSGGENDSIVPGLKSGELGEFDSRIPLASIDWHTGNAKTDSGPYLLSILGLEWSMRQCTLLSTRFKSKHGLAFREKLPVDIQSVIRSVDDGQKEDSTSIWELYKKKLKSWESLTWSSDHDDADSFGKEIDRACEARLPGYSPSVDACNAVAEDITSYWARPLLVLFSNQKSYKRLLEYAVRQNLLSTGFVTWYQRWWESEHLSGTAKAVAEDRYNQLTDGFREKYGKQQATALLSEYQEGRRGLEGLKHIDQSDPESPLDLLYSQTGQRAYVLGSIRASNYLEGKEANELNMLLPEPERFQCDDLHVLPYHLYSSCISHWGEQLGGKFFSKACEIGTRPSGSKDCLWHGSLLKQLDHNMEFSGAAAVRGASIFELLWAIWAFRKTYSRIDADFVLNWIDKPATTPEKMKNDPYGKILHRALKNVTALDSYLKAENKHRAKVREGGFSFYAMGFKRTQAGASEAGLSRGHYKEVLRERIKHLWDLGG